VIYLLAKIKTFFLYARGWGNFFSGEGEKEGEFVCLGYTERKKIVEIR
jgi:hypothetical protein